MGRGVPRASGFVETYVKFVMVCGLPSCKISKSAACRSGYAPASGIRDDGVHLHQVDIDADHRTRRGLRAGALRQGYGERGKQRCDSIETGWQEALDPHACSV